MYCEIKVAAFDMDGVLIKWRSSWRALHEYFGSVKLINESRDAERFLNGEISYGEWMRRDLEAIVKVLGAPPSKSDVVKAFSKHELMDGVEDLLKLLKSAGVITTIVSGGIDILAEMVSNELGIDIVLANKLVFNEDGYLIPRGVEVVNPLRKGDVLRNLSRLLNVPLEKFMYVGDTEWDFEAMDLVGYPVLLKYNEIKSPTEARYIVVNTLHDLKDLLSECLVSYK